MSNPTPASAGTTTYVARSLYDQPGYARQYDETRYKDDPKKAKRDMQTRAAIAEALRRLEGAKSLLDLPCGTGRLSAQVVEAGFAYTGADLSPSMLGVAKEKHAALKGATFVQADGEALPFADESFDAVMSVRFFNLVPSEPRRRILKEMRRVSRRWLVVASGYFRKSDYLWPLVAPVLPGIAKRVRENRELREDLAATGWRPAFWVPYRSRGPLSTIKMIGVFEK